MSAPLILNARFRLDQQAPCDLPGVTLWHGADLVLGRPVSVMVLAPSDAVDAALDGARRAALVTDPRLARVWAVADQSGRSSGETDDGELAYVVTEPLTSPTLTELVAGGPIDAGQARAIVGECALALDQARRRGVHHGAIRPWAVRVKPSPEESAVPGHRALPLISGLGFDAAWLDRLENSAMRQNRRDAVDLVALLYLLLTARWPSPGSVPPKDLVPSVPADLDTLCAVTFGPHVDGPLSPAELADSLAPWPLIEPGPEIYATGVVTTSFSAAQEGRVSGNRPTPVRHAWPSVTGTPGGQVPVAGTGSPNEPSVTEQPGTPRP